MRMRWLRNGCLQARRSVNTAEHLGEAPVAARPTRKETAAPDDPATITVEPETAETENRSAGSEPSARAKLYVPVLGSIIGGLITAAFGYYATRPPPPSPEDVCLARYTETTGSNHGTYLPEHENSKPTCAVDARGPVICAAGWVCEGEVDIDGEAVAKVSNGDGTRHTSAYLRWIDDYPGNGDALVERVCAGRDERQRPLAMGCE